MQVGVPVVALQPVQEFGSSERQSMDTFGPNADPFSQLLEWEARLRPTLLGQEAAVTTMS